MAKKKVGKITKPISLHGMESMPEHLGWLEQRRRARNELHNNVMGFLNEQANEDHGKMQKAMARIQEELGVEGNFCIGLDGGRWCAIPVIEKD